MSRLGRRIEGHVNSVPLFIKEIRIGQHVVRQVGRKWFLGVLTNMPVHNESTDEMLVTVKWLNTHTTLSPVVDIEELRTLQVEFRLSPKDVMFASPGMMPGQYDHLEVDIEQLQAVIDRELVDGPNVTFRVFMDDPNAGRYLTRGREKSAYYACIDLHQYTL